MPSCPLSIFDDDTLVPLDFGTLGLMIIVFTLFESLSHIHSTGNIPAKHW